SLAFTPPSRGPGRGKLRTKRAVRQVTACRRARGRSWGHLSRCSEQSRRKAATQSYGATAGFPRHARRAASESTEVDAGGPVSLRGRLGHETDGVPPQAIPPPGVAEGPGRARGPDPGRGRLRADRLASHDRSAHRRPDCRRPRKPHARPVPAEQIRPYGRLSNGDSAAVAVVWS